MVTLLISVKLHVICHELLLSDVFEGKELRLVLVVIISVRVILVAVEEATALGSRHA